MIHPALESFCPVHRFESHWPKSHIESLMGNAAGTPPPFKPSASTAPTSSAAQRVSPFAIKIPLHTASILNASLNACKAGQERSFTPSSPRSGIRLVKRPPLLCCLPPPPPAPRPRPPPDPLFPLPPMTLHRRVLFRLDSNTNYSLGKMQRPQTSWSGSPVCVCTRRTRPCFSSPFDHQVTSSRQNL